MDLKVLTGLDGAGDEFCIVDWEVNVRDWKAGYR